MPDTSAARVAIRTAMDRHRDVTPGLSMALTKLAAAGGQMRDLTPATPEDDPIWTDQAALGLAGALQACGKLQEAIVDAQGEVAKLGGQP